MQNVRASGFILPFTLLLASAVLALAVLGTSQVHRQLRLREHALLHSRSEAHLRLNVAPLVGNLATTILDSDSSSALVPLDPDIPGTLRTILVGPDGDRLPLHSESAPDAKPAVCFKSPLSDMWLAANEVALAPQGAPEQFTLAWAAEDIALAFPVDAPWPGWPLDSWFQSPRRNPPLPEDLLDPKTREAWPAPPWPAYADPLSFTETASPALVPVVTWLGLRLGIFASGAVGTREKIVRIRYYIEGGLWNPYNRALRLHDGGSQEAAFRLIFWNLPEVRIHNLSRGISTGWINLDQAPNSQTGSRGIEAWIRTAGSLEAGEEAAFLEPDPTRQPEGLARTLHGGFAVGPADHVAMEFRMPERGLGAACLPMDTDHPLEAARAGDGWFRVTDFPVEVPDMDFMRADEDPGPFYIGDGSLAFRSENAQAQILLKRSAGSFSGKVDPRRREIRYGSSFTDADGQPFAAAGLMDATVQALREKPAHVPAAVSRSPLFSWPDGPPQSLIEASDLPQWAEGFRLGSPNASRINSILDHETSFTSEAPFYEAAVPVNMLSPEGWKAMFRSSVVHPTNPETPAFAAYPSVSLNRNEDFRSWSALQLDTAAVAVTDGLRENPSRSISDFFNRGLLTKVFDAPATGDPILPLMPLRGWLRQTPPLRRHGSSWILHLLVEGKQNRISIRRSARVWLLERAVAADRARFEIIRFEWTDPAEHCASPVR